MKSKQNHQFFTFLSPESLNTIYLLFSVDTGKLPLKTKMFYFAKFHACCINLLSSIHLPQWHCESTIYP